MYPCKRYDIAAFPRLRRIPFQIRAHDTNRVIVVGHSRVISVDPAVLVVGSVDLERAEGTAVVAHNGADAPASLDLVQGFEKARWRGGVRKRSQPEVGC